MELLGAFGVRRGDIAIPVSGARVRGLLVRLALAGGRAVGPSALVDALWPDEQPADPANALQSLVSRLRRTLGSPELVEQSAAGYRLAVAPDLRGRGVGRWLLRTAEAAAGPGCGRILLTTGARSVRNIALYESEGYRALVTTDATIVDLAKPLRNT